MFIYESEGLPDVSQLQLQWNVGVGHGAHTDHTSAALPPERIRQQLDGVPFYLNVLKGMLHMIALAPGVAVDAAVRTAAIQINAIFRR